MDLIEAIKRNADSTTPRGTAMSERAHCRRAWMKNAGFQLHRHHQADPERNGDGYQHWASFAWSVLSQSVRAQSQPKAILIAAKDDMHSWLLAESAMVWFGDRGGAILVDPSLLVLLHPQCHRLCGSDKWSSEVSVSAHRLAALMLAQALSERVHLVLVAKTNNERDSQVLSGLLERGRYHKYEIGGTQQADDGIDHHSGTRQDRIASETIARNQTVKKGNREVRLGTFGHGNVVTAARNHAASPQVVPALTDPPTEPTPEPLPSAPISHRALAPDEKEVKARNKDVLRRQAMQANIRRKAGE